MWLVALPGFPNTQGDGSQGLSEEMTAPSEHSSRARPVHAETGEQVSWGTRQVGNITLPSIVHGVLLS